MNVESTIENQMKVNWLMVLLKGIIMILLALLVFSNPVDALITYALYIGIGFGIAGLLLVFQGISVRKGNSGWGWVVFEGFIDLFLGYVLVAHPALTAAIIPFIIGFWAVFYGVLLVLDSFSGTGSMLLKLMAGILIIILGNVVMFNPGAAGFTIAIWFGVLLLIVGIYNVIISFSLK
jgi:uncharacterized membrane protein HdeD (DUF308 family)